MWNGDEKPIKDVGVGDRIVAWDGKELVPDTVKNIWEAGIKPVVSVNDTIHCTEDHRFLTNTSSFNRVDSCRFIYAVNGGRFGNVSNPELAEFLGLMVTDGSITYNQTPKFTNINGAILDRMRYLSATCFPEINIKEYPKGNGRDLVFTLDEPTGRGQHPLRKFFMDSNKIPDMVWTFDRESLLAFFAGVIAGDGSISTKKSETPRGFLSLSAQLIIEAGISEQLAKDYQILLRKFGIKSIVKKDNRGNNHRVFVYSTKSLHKLKGIRIPCEYKQERLNHVLVYTSPNSGNVLRKEQVKRIIPIPPEQTYDLETETYHNFIANGYVVHNSGKDKTVINVLIKKMWEKVGVYYYFFPTFAQGKKIIWDGMDKDGMRFLDHFPAGLIDSKHNTEMKIRLKNGSLFQIVGTDNYNDAMGTNPIGCIFSEYSLQNPLAWDYFRPILMENGGWAIFVYTPRGKNHGFKLYEGARKSDEWFSSLLTVKDTRDSDGNPVITRAKIEKEIEDGMAEDMVEQEFYCSFDKGIEGSYYAKLMNRAQERGRVGDFQFDPAKAVDTFWDLGASDMTVIWFAQFRDNGITLIDYYESFGHGVEHYVNILDEKKREFNYNYGEHFAPHDVDAARFGRDNTESLRDMALDLGLEFVVVPRTPNVNHSIQSVRAIIPRCSFNEERCAEGIAGLENYRKEWNKKYNCYADRPLHDINSHRADGFRTLAEGIKERGAGGRSMTVQEVKELRARNMGLSVGPLS